MILLTLPILCQGLIVGLINKEPISLCADEVYSGFVHDLLSVIFQDPSLGTISIEYICFESYDSAASALSSSTIDVTFLPMSSPNYQSFIFTIPFLNNGLVLLAKNYTKSLFWVIYEPFEVEFWVLLIFLPLILGHFYWFFERSKDGLVDLNYFSGISQSVWQVCLCIFFLKREETKKISTKLMIFTYWFFNFIVVASYITTLSSILIKISRQVDGDSFLSMENKLVATYEEFSETLKNLNIDTKAYTSSGIKPYINILNDVLDETVDAGAFLYSEAWLLNSEYCQVTLLGSIFIDSYLGFAFNSDSYDQSIFKHFQINLQSLLDEQFVKRLINKHLLLTYSKKCNDGLDLPLPIDLLITCLIHISIILLFAIPLFILFRRSLYKIKITEGELMTVQTTTSGTEKELAHFMNMMIKFEGVLGSSKINFNNKFEELRTVLNDCEIISNQYEDLLKKLLFRIENV